MTELPFCERFYNRSPVVIEMVVIIVCGLLCHSIFFFIIFSLTLPVLLVILLCSSPLDVKSFKATVIMSEPPFATHGIRNPLTVPSMKRNGSKWRDPVVTFPPGDVRPHFGVYVIWVLDSVSGVCQILLTFQSCVAQFSIIFSLPRVSCTSKEPFFILACFCCCFLRNVLYTDLAF